MYKQEEKFPLEGEELEFYRSVQECCTLYAAENLEYRPIPFVKFNETQVQGSPDRSYGPHHDCESDMISVDPNKPKRLSNGIQLPYRDEMGVGTTCVCWSYATIKGHLMHGPKLFGRHTPYTKANVSGSNIGHAQLPALNDSTCLHAMQRLQTVMPPIPRELMLHSIIDKGAPKKFLPENVSVTERMMKMRFISSQRQV